MASRQPVYRIPASDQDLTVDLRRMVQDARDLLKRPPPDTFLGRRTFEPFPAEDKNHRPKPR